VDAFWDWLGVFLPNFAESNAWKAQPDLSRILCVGQSTGGCLAVQSALMHPDLHFKAVISLYAPLEYNVPSFTVPFPRRILGTMPPPSRQAESLLRAYNKKTKGTVRTEGDPVTMWELLLCMLQQGRVPAVMNAKKDSRLNIISMLKQVRRLPPLWLIHGKEDTVVGCPPLHTF
jgi:pimeloyl-ACP methyl ester carboxylesterase